MKKVIIGLLSLVLLVAFSGCGASGPKEKMTAEVSLSNLKEKISTISSVTIFDESTDPNKNLGKPGQYVGKGDFFDNRMENAEEMAGTIEFFSSKKDCNDRYTYLSELSDPALGAFGVNQYIYKYGLAIFRVSFDFNATEAGEYKTAMDEIMDEVSTQQEGK